MSKLQGKVAVITGATSGMGLDTAKLFLEQGAKVVITGRSQEKLDALKGNLTGEYLLINADVRNSSDNDSLLSETVSKFGKIDILFLNAGIFKALPIGNLTESFIDEIYDINFKGPVITLNKALPYLNDGASVIFNTSVSHVKGMPGLSIYASSKAALRSAIRSFANELSSRNIRVNAVSPGPIETPLWGKTNLSEEEINGFAQNVSTQVPLGRFGKGTEVANTALFLASDQASYITGVEIPIDGGMTQV